MRSIPLKIDVTEAAGFGQPQFVAGTVFLPEQLAPGRNLIIFASPGGGYTQHYFDMRFEGRTGYSEAEYHTRRGIVFVAMDHLGVGESSLDRMDDLRVETIARGNDAFVREVTSRLKAGRIAPDFAKLENPFLVGIGQSMGGGITMIMQGMLATFDAIAPLGKSALHTALPQPTMEQFNVCRDIYKGFSRGTPLNELNLKLASGLVPDFVYPFHWPDEPEDIVKADMDGGYPMRKAAPNFGSLTVPRCAIAMMSPAFCTPDAGRITVPVLMGFGERDTSQDPRREPTAFISSNDVSVFIVPGMAHMHNFAHTREILWRRIADWSVMQAEAA